MFLPRPFFSEIPTSLTLTSRCMQHTFRPYFFVFVVGGASEGWGSSAGVCHVCCSGRCRQFLGPSCLGQLNCILRHMSAPRVYSSCACRRCDRRETFRSQFGFCRIYKQSLRRRTSRWHFGGPAPRRHVGPCHPSAFRTQHRLLFCG